MKRSLLALCACLIAVAASPLAAQAGAPSRVIDSYCSPSGDYCTSITRSAKGKVVLSLRTYAFTDKYKLCVEAPVRQQARECGYWSPRDKGNGLYVSNVVMRDHFFFKGPGRYRITWWYGDGNRLGKPLSFEK